MVIQTQQRETDQHEHAAQQGVQHVLERGIFFFLADTPQFNQEIAGHEHEFPEHEEENQVDGNENPHNRRFQSQDTHKVRFDVVLNGVPGIENDQDRDEGREADEQDADAVHGKVIGNTESRNPIQPFAELHGRGFRYEPEQHEDGESQLEHRDSQCKLLDQVGIPLRPQPDRPEKREKEQDR